MEALENLFYSGTSGLVIPLTKAHFPIAFKDKTRLHYYSSLFNSVEINSIFYKLPKSSTVSKWAEAVPNHFRFTFKVPKSITHARRLEFSMDDINNFMEIVDVVGSKKGCLLAQFPPSFNIDRIDELQTFLEAFQSHVLSSSWNLALEFRNTSWYVPRIHELLQKQNAQMVLHDMQGAAMPFPWPKMEAKSVYIRFHGPEPRYRGSYSDAFLKSAATYIRECIGQKKTVYVYFNNTLGGAFDNLQTLNSYVRSPGI